MKVKTVFLVFLLMVTFNGCGNNESLDTQNENTDNGGGYDKSQEVIDKTDELIGKTQEMIDTTNKLIEENNKSKQNENPPIGQDNSYTPQYQPQTTPAPYIPVSKPVNVQEDKTPTTKPIIEDKIKPVSEEIDKTETKPVIEDLNETKSIDENQTKFVNEDLNKTKPLDENKTKPIIEDLNETKPLDENQTKSVSEDLNKTKPLDENKTQPIEEDKNIVLDLDDEIFRNFNVGFGNSGSFPFANNKGEVVWLSSTDLLLDDNIENNGYYKTIKNFNAQKFDILQQKLKKTKYISYWFSSYWEENWHNAEAIQNAMNAGYVPVFHYWYFADALDGGLPDEGEISAYYQHNIKIANFLKKLKGKKIVIMEPEFNKNIVVDVEANQYKFASIISKAIDNIKSNTSDVLFSLCMMDTGNRGENETYPKCGYETCALGDKKEWDKPHIIYTELLDKLDFISFQEMIGQFSRNHDNPGGWKTPNPQYYSDEALGINILDKRISNFAKYLKDKYKKPVFMPYIAIATATWNDSNGDMEIDKNEINDSGWETQANNVYMRLMQRKNELLENGMFGFTAMTLFDNPNNDINGYQYFLDNEYHLGIIKSSAVGGVDKYSFGDIEFKQDIIDIISNY